MSIVFCDKDKELVKLVKEAVGDKIEVVCGNHLGFEISSNK